MAIVKPVDKFVGEFALLLDCADDKELALLYFAGFFVRQGDRMNLHLVETAGHFLAVTADERNRCTVVEQAYCGIDLMLADACLSDCIC